MGGACCSSSDIPSRATLLDNVSPKRNRVRSKKGTTTDPTDPGGSEDDSDIEIPKKKRSIFSKTVKPIPMDKDESFIEFSDDTNDSQSVDYDDKIDGDMDVNVDMDTY